MNGTKLTPVMTGLDLEGRPVTVYRGQVAVIHVWHDRDCPGSHGHPDLCRCKIDKRLEIIRGRPL